MNRVAAMATGVLIACSTPNSRPGIALYETGRAVPLEREDAAGLLEQANRLFYQCRTSQMVTGLEEDQAELIRLRDQLRAGTHALAQESNEGDAPFADLRGREFTLLLGLDSEHGVTSVLTEHENMLTSYVKCPGLEAMALGCQLSQRLPAGGEWSVCGTVDRIRRELRE